VPDAVNAVVCAPDDGWGYYPKFVERFSRNKKTVWSCISLEMCQEEYVPEILL